MYIAIILENFAEANRDEEIGIVEDDLEMFYVRWSRLVKIKMDKNGRKTQLDKN